MDVRRRLPQSQNRRRPGHSVRPDLPISAGVAVNLAVKTTGPNVLEGPGSACTVFGTGSLTVGILESDGARIEGLQILLGHKSIAMSLHYAGQAAATARRGVLQYSPVAKFGLQLGRCLQRGRPKRGCSGASPRNTPTRQAAAAHCYALWYTGRTRPVRAACTSVLATVLKTVQALSCPTPGSPSVSPPSSKSARPSIACPTVRQVLPRLGCKSGCTSELVQVGGRLPGMEPGRLGCSNLLGEGTSRCVTETPRDCPD